MRRFVRYSTIGALATATHYLVLVLCVEGGGWAAWVASGLGAVIGAQVAYFGNRRYTFAHRGAFAGSSSTRSSGCGRCRGCATRAMCSARVSVSSA
ncbi:MAG TPA: GtrA family protein, partial [Caldimonas sp.]